MLYIRLAVIYIPYMSQNNFKFKKCTARKVAFYEKPRSIDKLCGLTAGKGVSLERHPCNIANVTIRSKFDIMPTKTHMSFHY